MFKYFKEIGKAFKLKHYVTYFIIIAFIAITTIITLTSGFKRSTAIMFETIGYNLIAALSLSLVVGFLGELSLGHAAFMSIGAMFGALSQQTIFKSVHNTSPLLSLILGIIVGGSVAAIAGFLIGLPALRLKGDYLAIVTLAFGEIVKVIFQNVELFGGALGLKNSGYRFDYKYLFIIIFVFVLLTLVLIKNLLKSKHGRAIMSIRDNEIASRAMGVNVTYYKLFIFVVSSFLAGVAGVLFAASQNQIQSATFNYNYSINNILVMVVLGGMGNINGTIVASIVVSILNIKLQTVFTGDLAAIKNIIYALILILVVLYNNVDFLKSFREKYNFKNLVKWIKKKIFKISESDANTGNELRQADWSKVPTKINMDAIVTTDFEMQNSGPDKGGFDNE